MMPDPQNELPLQLCGYWKTGATTGDGLVAHSLLGAEEFTRLPS